MSSKTTSSLASLEKAGAAVCDPHGALVGRSSFAFELPRAQPVHLSIHDVSGRQVRVLQDGALAARAAQRDSTSVTNPVVSRPQRSDAWRHVSTRRRKPSTSGSEGCAASHARTLRA